MARDSNYFECGPFLIKCGIGILRLIKVGIDYNEVRKRNK